MEKIYNMVMGQTVTGVGILKCWDAQGRHLQRGDIWLRSGPRREVSRAPGGRTVICNVSFTLNSNIKSKILQLSTNYFLPLEYSNSCYLSYAANLKAFLFSFPSSLIILNLTIGVTLLKILKLEFFAIEFCLSIFLRKICQWRILRFFNIKITWLYRGWQPTWNGLSVCQHFPS